MPGRFAGKVAIVTGSGQSIGRAIARLLAAEGASVVTNSRTAVSRDDTPTAADTAREIVDAGGRAVPVFGDVGTMAVAKTLIDAAVTEFGALDIIVNNAGFANYLKLEEMTEASWDAELATNLKAPFAMAHYGVPHLKARGGGRILNVISRVGLHGAGGMAAYAAAKAGVLGLTFTLAKELAGDNITINCLAPTANTVRADRTAAERNARMGYTPQLSSRRTPEHIAPIAAYLVSDAATSINGQIFYAAAGHVTLYAPPLPRNTIITDDIWSLEALAKLVPEAFGAVLEPPSAPVSPV